MQTSRYVVITPLPEKFEYFIGYICGGGDSCITVVAVYCRVSAIKGSNGEDQEFMVAAQIF